MSEPDLTIDTGAGEELSDLGNARRFIRAFGETVRWVEARGEWIYYTGTVWMADTTLQIERFGQLVVQAIFTEAAVAGTAAERRDCARHAMRSQSARAIRDMLQLARPHLVITPAELDADRYALAVQNGVLDLRTGELRPPQREDYITKQLPIPYEPAAAAPLWDQVLDRIMAGNQSLIDYIQRIFGYALTGDVREQNLYVFHGLGANGKSTVLNTMRTLLGSHSAQLATDVLLARGGDAMFVLNQLASIENKRLVVASEAELGRRLAESLVKQLCGSDPIRVRKLFHEPYEIEPTWTLVLNTNHRPRVRGRDHGMWRRVKLVPFTVCIPGHEQDRQLPEKLKAELPGILAWALRGCLAWQRNGLRDPEEVTQATAAYRAEEDAIGQFLEERCIRDPKATVTVTELYQAYVDWAKAAGEPQLSKTEFGKQLAEAGFDPGRKGRKQTRQWVGLRLRTLMDPEPADTEGGQTHADTYLPLFTKVNLLAGVIGENASARVCTSAPASAPSTPSEDTTSDCYDPPEELPL